MPSPKRILLFQSDKIAGVTECNDRFKRQLPAQFSNELGARHRFSNDKCSCSADVHDIIGGQVSASMLGRNVRCPPTLIPRRKTIRAILRLWWTSLLQHQRSAPVSQFSLGWWQSPKPSVLADILAWSASRKVSATYGTGSRLIWPIVMPAQD